MRNRRALADELPGLEAGHQARGDSLAIALCDVDRFKVYNDELGHLAGDQALRAIAATIRGSLRGKDMAYRFGGEELLIVLPDTTAEEALAAVERVRAAVQAAALPHPAGIGGVLTVSIGVAAGHADYGKLLAPRRLRAVLGQARGPQSRRRRDGVRGAARGRPRACRRRAGGRPASPAQHARAVTGRGVGCRRDGSARVARADDPLRALVPGGRTQPARRRPRELMRVVAVDGDEEARQALLGTSSSWAEWSALMRPENMREGALWLAAGTYQWQDEAACWTPPAAAALGPDGWHPEDMLMLPLRGAASEIIGMVSLDQPLHGRRPDDAEIAVLMAVADQAGLAIEQAASHRCGRDRRGKANPTNYA